ncbi:MAG: DUF2997 domain-containing protein [Phycisphaerae bacterium]
MMTKIIEILIDRQGQTKIQTRGFSGASCKDASRQLEQALGQAQSEEQTAEYYQPAQSHTEQQQQI